jgi:hypothetical protein
MNLPLFIIERFVDAFTISEFIVKASPQTMLYGILLAKLLPDFCPQLLLFSIISG